ncbi:DNA polymerase III subunit gamma/tau [Patescibacteria group bacterium]|nr:DNA polymerase III subunit gamma/tau [Patescibacteria group bacterium]
MKQPLTIKYRPKKLADVIGQDVVTKSFTNAFKNNSMHHAYILAGQFGTGKTTVGRIVAAMENCDKGRTLNPCGKCTNCKEIFSGKSFEVQEKDAASNRGIEDIRNINKEIYHCPINCRTKYIILDEAHRLTGGAAEAALKMIEEPPEFVKFIFATTELHRIKDTIRSRCITFKFNKVDWRSMYTNLNQIVKNENIECDDEALSIASKVAKGSVRNSLQNLQTMVNYVGNKKITAEDAKKAMGTVSEKVYFELINSIFEGQTHKAFLNINSILKDGKDAGIIIDNLYLYINNLMIAFLSKDKMKDLNFSESEIKRYLYQKKQITSGEVLCDMLSYMVDVSKGLKLNMNPEVLLNQFVVNSIISVIKNKK